MPLPSAVMDQIQLTDTSDPRQFRPKTIRHQQDSPVLVPKCPDTLASRYFGPSTEIVRTIGVDTSALGPGHFGTSVEVPSYCDRMVESH